MGNEESISRKTEKGWGTIIINTTSKLKKACKELSKAQLIFLDAQMCSDNSLSVLVLKAFSNNTPLSQAPAYVIQLFPFAKARENGSTKKNTGSESDQDQKRFIVETLDALRTILESKQVVTVFGYFIIRQLREGCGIKVSKSIDVTILHLALLASQKECTSVSVSSIMHNFQSLSRMAAYYVKDYSSLCHIGFYGARQKRCFWDNFPLGEYEIEKAAHDCNLLALLYVAMNMVQLREDLKLAVQRGSAIYFDQEQTKMNLDSSTQASSFSPEWFRTLFRRKSQGALPMATSKGCRLREYSYSEPAGFVQPSAENAICASAKTFDSNPKYSNTMKDCCKRRELDCPTEGGHVAPRKSKDSIKSPEAA